MKYKYGKYYFDQVSQEKKYVPRIYTDFYCSLKEWHNLGTGKKNFMYQVRSHIVDLYGYMEDNRTELEKWKAPRIEKKIKFNNGLLTLNKLSFDRVGRRDSMEGEKYSAWIIKNVIKLITNRNSEVTFYSWKGTVDHIEISFPQSTMPNIICLIDENCGSTNEELIFCIDCIYKTLNNKTTEWYDRYLHKFYNENYDIVYLKNKSSDTYYEWKYKSQWKDIIKQKSNRTLIDKVSIAYK